MKKRFKRGICAMLAGLIFANFSTGVISKAASADELGKQMISYYESKEFTEDDLENIKSGITNADALRLMGIMTSNWMEPGLEVDIEDTKKLAKTLAEPIKNNLIQNESVANAYASAIASNIATGSKSLKIKKVTGTRNYNGVDIRCNRAYLNQTGKEGSNSNGLATQGTIGNYLVKMYTTAKPKSGQLDWNRLQVKSHRFMEIKKVLRDNNKIYAYQLKDGKVYYVYDMIAEGVYGTTFYGVCTGSSKSAVDAGLKQVEAGAKNNSSELSAAGDTFLALPNKAAVPVFNKFCVKQSDLIVSGADYLPEMKNSKRIEGKNISLNEILIGDKLKAYSERKDKDAVLPSDYERGGMSEALTEYIELQDDSGNVVWSSGNISCRTVGYILRNKIITKLEGNALSTLCGSSRKKVKNKEKTGDYGDYGDSVNLVLDCFGNIWATKGDSKGYLLVPGCTNPYTFSKEGNVTPLDNCHMLGYFYSNKFKSTSAFKKNNSFTTACIQRNSTNAYVMDCVKANKKTSVKSTSKYFGNGKTYVLGGNKPVKDTTGEQKFSDKFVLFDVKKEATTYTRAIPRGITSYISDSKKNSMYGTDKNVKGGNISNLYHKGNLVSLDLLVYGGVWEENGGWVSIIEDGSKDMAKSAAFCGDSDVNIDKYGNVYLTEAKKANFVYGLYIVYAYVMLGQEITIDKDTYLGNNTSAYGKFDTASLGAGKVLPDVITDESTYNDLLEKLQKDVADSALQEDKKNIITALATLLNPKASFGYVTSLLNQRTSELTLSWHYGLLGLNNNIDNSVLSGNIGYSGSNGYLTVPELENISWTNSILENFDTLLIVALVIISAIMAVYILLSMRSIQRAILNIFVFGFCLFLVPALLSNTIILANKVSNSFVSGRFQYWVIAQQQAFIKELNEASEQDNAQEYLSKAATELAAFATGESTVATVQWMSPKKDNYVGQILGVLEDNGDAESNKVIANKAIFSTIKRIGTTMLSGQKYTDGDAGYIYRSYSDISMYAKMNNKALAWKIDNDKDVNSLNYFDTNSYAKGALGNDEDLQKRYSLNSGYPILDKINEVEQNNTQIAIDKNTGGSDQSGTNTTVSSTSPSTAGDSTPSEEGGTVVEDKQTRYRLITTSETVNKAITQSIKRVNIDSTNVEDYTIGDYAYGFAINYSDKDFRPVKMANIYKKDDSEKYSLDKLAEYQFLLYTESPFYYMFNNFSDKGTMTDTDGAFKSYVLGDGNITSTDVVNSKGKAAVVDYMDFESFFKYVLPYMRQACDVVTDYDRLYGMNVYKTITDVKGDLAVLKDNEKYKDELQKIWHNEMVSRLWNMYSPWVDTMEECDYAKAEKFTTLVNGVQIKATVQDPLNPASYKKMKYVDGKWYGREMVFGEEQMLKAGLKYNQLSSVEKKIYNVLDKSTSDIYLLLNYYTYDNQVLTTSAAMSVLFNFNREFSQNKVLGESKKLYPQSYALSNFSYDSYLRMSMINATGMSLIGGGGVENQGVYATIVSKTNGFVGLIMCLNDILSVFMLTNLKIFFVVALLVLGILSVVCCITVEEYKIIQTFKDSVIIPCFKFLLLTVVHAFVASILMGTTPTNIITGVNTSSNISDPVGVLLALLVVHIILVILYVKLAVKMVSNIISMGVSVVGGVAGAVAQLGNNLVSATGVKPSMVTGDNTRNFSGSRNSKGSVIDRDRRFNRRLNSRFKGGVGSSGLKNRTANVAKGVTKTLGAAYAVGTANRLGTVGLAVGATAMGAKFLGKRVRRFTPLGRYERMKNSVKNGTISDSQLKAFYKKHDKGMRVQSSVEKIGRGCKNKVVRGVDKVANTVTTPIRAYNKIKSKYTQNKKLSSIRKDIKKANSRARKARYFGTEYRPENTRSSESIGSERR